MSEAPPPEEKPRDRVDPEDIRRALEAHAQKRPPRPPAVMIDDPIPRRYVPKPPNRSRKNKNRP